MMPKEFISPSKLFNDSFLLARKIHDSGYRPDILLVLWRGGAPVGLVVHEFLSYKGIKVNQIVVKAESYSGIGNRRRLRIESFSAGLSKIKKETRVLVVDDIFDSGETAKGIEERLSRKTKNIRIATLYLRQGCKTGPDYYVRKVSTWVVLSPVCFDQI